MKRIRGTGAGARTRKEGRHDNFTGLRDRSADGMMRDVRLWNMTLNFKFEFDGKAVLIMKAVIQRVSRASVTVDGQVIGAIGQGYMVLLGVAQGDDRAAAERIAKKMLGLRIFADENGKTNLSIRDVNGSLLIVSQFTLCADTRHGNRPSFITAAPPELANELYEYFIELCRQQVPQVEHGEFGADMKVELVNDGPFTIILE